MALVLILTHLSSELLCNKHPLRGGKVPADFTTFSPAPGPSCKALGKDMTRRKAKYGI